MRGSASQVAFALLEFRPLTEPMASHDQTRAVTKLPSSAESPWVLLRTVTNHPFVYKKMVRDVAPEVRPGDVVAIYDRNGALVGRGLFNPRSQIVVRILSRGDVAIDDCFWRARLERAVGLRRQLGVDGVTDAYRLVHAEGDELPGLIVERYADHLVFEVFSLGVFQRYEQIAQALIDVLPPATGLDRPDRAGQAWHRVLRADTRVSRIEGFFVRPEDPPPAGRPGERVVIREHGVRYRVDIRTGHKTGFFCDQRENRMRFAGLCRDARVLDLCCYTGGFGLCARCIGGAREVTGVDLDEAAVALARENANLNQTRIDFVYADAFTFIRQMLKNNRQFDAVVLDPPKLANYRGELDEALQKYSDLNALAVQVVRPGGVLLTCSCSGLVSRDTFRSVVYQSAQRAQRPLQLFHESGAAPDHPVMLNCPESAYLKALWFRVH
jgi:23S rRNA (cytosine1962-C5)-methyltransferase